MNISFAPGQWENSGLVYAYSWRFPALPVFNQEADCIANSRSQDDPQDYDYMGLLLPRQYTAGARLSVRCSFEALGAPMLLLSAAEETDAQGILRTLEYYEVVIWKNGLNVWRHHTEGRKCTYYKLLGASFPLAEGESHTLSAELQSRRLVLDVDGHRLDLYVHDLPDALRLGYTACEGICRLYDLRVEALP